MRARPGELADLLDVSGASVTEMLTTLDDRGLASYRKYEGVTLTDEGEAVAREFAWRRCVAENFLEDDLGLNVAALAEGGDADGSDADREDPRAIVRVLSDEAVHRLKDRVNHPCDGKCNAPNDEYSACSDDVRETAEDVDAEL